MNKVLYALLGLLLVGLFGLGVVLVGGKIAFDRQQDLSVILHKLERADETRTCNNMALYRTLGLTLHDIADNFSTPPYPDPTRKEAVDRLNSLGDVLEHFKAVPCKGG